MENTLQNIDLSLKAFHTHFQPVSFNSFNKSQEFGCAKLERANSLLSLVKFFKYQYKSLKFKLLDHFERFQPM